MNNFAASVDWTW